MKPTDISSGLTAEHVRQLFDYDKNTGILTHKRRHAVKEGARAGCVMNHGYIGVKVHQRLVLAHRLIWLWMIGMWPAHDIDHINRDRADNRWVNLREATRVENCINSMVRRDGLKGAWFNKRERKWVAGVQENGKRRHLGYFATEQEAHEAYVAAAREVYGEFARAG